MEPIVFFICMFGTVFGVSYVFLTTRNKERLALIQNGADASLFESKGSKFSISKFILNIALLFVGIGIGIFVGDLIHRPLGIDDGIAVASMIFIFGGLALIVGFFLTRKIEKEKE